jgi:hypothetical protein
MVATTRKGPPCGSLRKPAPSPSSFWTTRESWRSSGSISRGIQHAEDAQRLHDEKRSAFLSEQNITVLRFWNQDVFLRPRAVLEEILRELDGLPDRL